MSTPTLVSTLGKTAPLNSPKSTGESRSAASIYLVFSFAAGLIELGSVIFATRQSLSVPIVLSFGLAYQLGALFTNPIRLTGRQYRLLVAAAIFTTFGAKWNICVLSLAVFLLSAGLQGLRDQALQQGSVGTFPKRVARLLGFAAAGLFYPVTIVVVSILVLSLAKALGGSPAIARCEPQHAHNRPFGLAGLAMIVHQMHYFVYAYALPIIFIRTHTLSDAGAALAFAVGWVSYSIAPSLLGRLPAFGVVLAGHVGVAIAAMVIVAKSDDLGVLLAAWFASGFGGGTVFGIRRLAKHSSFGAVDDVLDMWENIGHVFGVVLAVGISLVAFQFRTFFLAAAALALLVPVILALLRNTNSVGGDRGTQGTRSG